MRCLQKRVKATMSSCPEDPRPPEATCPEGLKELEARIKKLKEENERLHTNLNYLLECGWEQR